MKMDALPRHEMYIFLDEKHLVNKDIVSTKCRAHPLIGHMDCIPVSGDFRETYNLLAIISANPAKEKHVAYHVRKENGDSVAFYYVFICSLIMIGFFLHHEVLVMGNTTIHTGGASGEYRRVTVKYCYQQPPTAHSRRLPSRSLPRIKPHQAHLPHPSPLHLLVLLSSCWTKRRGRGLEHQEGTRRDELVAHLEVLRPLWLLG
jgi:hypothetical protein